MLDQAAVEANWLEAGLARPAGRPAVDVMDVKNFGAAVNQPLFNRVAQVAPGNGCGRVATTIGAINQRLVEAAKGLLLQLQPVHKRFAAVIEGAVAGPV